MRNSSIVNRRDRCFSFCYGLLFWVVSSTIKLHDLFVVVSCTSINLVLWNRWSKLFIEGCWSHNSSFLFMRTDQIFAVLHDSLMVQLGSFSIWLLEGKFIFLFRLSLLRLTWLNWSLNWRLSLAFVLISIAWLPSCEVSWHWIQWRHRLICFW